MSEQEEQPPSEAIETSFDYPLKGVLTYAHQGQTVDASFIRFGAPTSKHKRECAILKQSLMRAFSEMPSRMRKMFTDDEIERQERAAEEKTEEKIEGPTVIEVLSMSSEVDFAEVVDTAARLFTKTKPDVAFIDGEERLTAAKYDELSYDDVEAMTGEYIARFFAGSVRRTRKSRLSAPS